MATPQDLEAVLGPDPAPFELLINKLTSISNDERNHAEQVFTECKKHPDLLVRKFLSALSSCQNPPVRKLCAILLRKTLTRDTEKAWKLLSPEVQNSVKAQLLLCVEQENSQSISKQLCDVISELAAEISDDGQWPELLPFMFKCVSAESPKLKETALLIFSQLAHYIGLQLVPHLATLREVLRQCLESPSPSVRLAALRSTCSFVETLESNVELQHFQELIPGIMNSLMSAFQTKDETSVIAALESLIDVASTEPRFLRRHLEQIVQVMMQIVETPLENVSPCQLALEFLVTLAEARERAPGMMRKLTNLPARMMASLMRLLTDITDDPDWYTGNPEDEDAGTSVAYDAAYEYLDRIAMALGGNSILPVSAELFPLYLNDADWRKRHAALIVLSQIAEGCSKLMLQNLEPVINMPLGLFGDPHPRVRWAAINAIGQLSADLAPDVQEKFHGQIIPALVTSMDDFSNPRVQAHAAAAFLNFCEAATPDILLPYLDVSISKLLILLQQGKRIVQEGALTALAAAADCAQEQFAKYYSSVYPLLKTILINATDKDNRMLRAKAMECVSLIGMAVGKEVFRNDATEIMHILATLEGTKVDEDDPTTSYKLQAWTRLCKCLGQEFLPFMHVVMPPLIQSAALKPDVTITEADFEEEEEDEEDENVETITIGDKKIGIRTSVLEEKATACNMISCFADELKEGFFPWVEEIAKLMVPLLKFYFHEEVRKASVSSIPDLIKSAKLAVDKGLSNGKDLAYVKDLVYYCLPPLIDVLIKEPETDIIIEMLDSINESLLTVNNLVGLDLVQSLVDQIKKVMEESKKRRGERAKRRDSEDFDEEENEVLEEEIEQENEVIEQVGEVLGTLMKTFQGSIQPIIHGLLPGFFDLASPQYSSDERRVALCVFDDVLENFGPESIQYYPTLLPLMLSSSVDPYPDVRQSSIFGIGLAAQFGGEHFRPYLQESLKKLMEVVVQPDSRSASNVSATDNAISALGKIIEYQPLSDERVHVLTTWFSYLPVKSDLEEAKIVHNHLCTLLERNDPIILGPSNENLPRIFSVLSEIVANKELASEETASKFIAFLLQSRSSVPPAVIDSVYSRLPLDQQTHLKSILG